MVVVVSGEDVVDTTKVVVIVETGLRVVVRGGEAG